MNRSEISNWRNISFYRRGALTALLSAFALALSGCGAGGYAGGELTNLSSSVVTIDATQAFRVDATTKGTLPVSWSLSGPACSGSGCGSVAQPTGMSNTYTAPATAPQPVAVSLMAQVSGTKNSKTVAITVNPAPVINGDTPDGVVGTAYSATLTPTLGTGTLKLTFVAGSLPAGLSFDAPTGKITGTPTTAGSVSFRVQAVDQSDVPFTVSVNRTITITDAVQAPPVPPTGPSTSTLAIANGSPVNGTVAVPYSYTLTASGGTSPYTWSVLSGSLPNGLTLLPNGTIAGLPLTAGTSTFVAQVQDASGATVSATMHITIAPAQLGLLISVLPNGTVGVPYSATVGVAGGVAPYTCSLVTGSMPAGLTLNANCSVTGTPTLAGIFAVVVRATDSGSPAQVVTGPITITISPAQLVLSLSVLPTGTVGVPYAATIGVGGGTAPYTCALASGTMPAGLTLNANCSVSGTPTAAGISLLNVRATDSSSPAQVTTGIVTLTVVPATLSLSISVLPNGTVNHPYNATIAVGGGTAPYSCSLTGGTLPTGLTLNSDCSVTGTPTVVTTSVLTVRATDSGSPAQVTTGVVSISILPINLGISISVLPGGTVGVPYAATIATDGGVGPYTCSLVGGTLPAGLTLNNNCSVTGTPTAAGIAALNVHVTDSESPAQTTTGIVGLTIAPATLGLSISVLPSGTVGVPYSATIGVGGGTAPFTCTLTGGTLPAGLTLNNNCTVTGTPTAATIAALTVHVTDSSSPAQSTTGVVALTIAPSSLAISISVLPSGTVGVPYSATIGVGGGTAPFACTLTSGTLPAGLTLNSNCSVTGTPTAATIAALTVHVTDSGSPAQSTTGVVALTIAPASLAISISVLPSGTVGTSYNATIGVGGGVAPYSCILVSGTLQAGLTLNSNCSVTGTPTTAGIAALVVKATDSASPAQNTTATVALTIFPPGLNFSVSVLPNATFNSPYSATLSLTGGTAPYSCSLVSGVIPTGLTLNSNCTITGTPTQIINASALVIRGTDSSSPAQTTTVATVLTVLPINLGIGISILPGGTVNTPYSATVAVAGGIAPYTCQLVGGTMPAGLTLNSNCSVTGTPTAPAIAALSIKATDSSSPAQTTTSVVALTISPASLGFSISVLPNGVVGTAYNQAVTLSGGVAPYTCQLTGGIVPAGITLNSNCTVTGTPTAPAIAALIIKASDSQSPAQEITATVALTVTPAPLNLSLSLLPNGVVGTAYSANITANGGVAPYTCVLVTGTVPAGLTLNSNCSVTGTPTAPAIAALNVKLTDSASPAVNSTGIIALTVTPAPLNLSLSILPTATVGNVYSANITANGGVAPYTCSLLSGVLPTGLTLGADCSVTGTPTTATIDSFNVKLTDSASPGVNTTGIIALTVLPAPLNFTISVLPNGVVNSPYSATLSLSGGTAPYACSLTSGVLPTGLTLNSNCTITGTPTQILNASVLTIHATDSATPALSANTVVALTVTPINLGITISVLPGATVGVPYTATVAVAGGVAPYTCSLDSGIMPAGLTLNSNCSVTGTATAAGLAALIIRATDSNSPAQSTTAVVALTVLPAIPTLTLTPPSNATLGTLYAGNIGVTGGTAPYTCLLASGTLPAGLTLGNDCSLSGTPTATGASTVTILAADAATTAHTGSGILVITVNPATALAFTGTLNAATQNAAFSQTLAATGGVAPYTYAVTAGQLPTGISLVGGVLSGTPTTPGATSFTVTVMDSQGTPATVSLPLVMMVNYPTTASDALMNGHYAFLFQGYDDVVAGVLAYQTAIIGSFTADGTGKVASGLLDRNSQLSTATGNILDSNNFVGTYTVGLDGRGLLAVTPFNADGTTGGTAILAIILKPAVSPATASVEGSMIAFDNNGLVGTKGSGSLLKQDTTAMAAGLNGSYAFGLSGDTPCLPSCSIGIVAGPVATVGQFTASSSVVSGTGDAIIGNTNYPSSSLSGNYLPADANGRVQLSLNNTMLAGTPYPVDYAVYVVDANRAFMMSRDKHSTNILQAGTATLQTVSNFTAAAHLNAPFVGYENGAVNPGLVGTVLNNTLNLSSASVFQAQGNGNGTCTTNLSDTGGLTGLVQALTGFGSSNNILNAVLGTYQTLGTGNCTVSSNGRAVIAYPAPSGLLATLLTTLGLGGQQAPPRVAYLTGANSGYFLETSYATLGHMEAQTGTPFSNATLHGTYLYGTSSASSLVTINASGSFTADGAGNATQTLDNNIGVGTINVLGLGVTAATTYNVTDTTHGRFLLGSSRVIYAISPGRYVLLEQNPLSTSPYTALLY